MRNVYSWRRGTNCIDIFANYHSFSRNYRGPRNFVKNFLFCVGRFYGCKGRLDVNKKDDSIVECILARRECDYIYYDTLDDENKFSKWRHERSKGLSPKIKGDITCETANECFGELK